MTDLPNYPTTGQAEELDGSAAAEVAYRMGRSVYGEDTGIPRELVDTSEDRFLGRIHDSLDYYKESARWANTDAPRLRALAGYQDGGHGTYQVCPGDTVHHRHRRFIDRFTEGYTDAAYEAWEDAQEGGQSDAG